MIDEPQERVSEPKTLRGRIKSDLIWGTLWGCGLAGVAFLGTILPLPYRFHPPMPLREGIGEMWVCLLGGPILGLVRPVLKSFWGRWAAWFTGLTASLFAWSMSRDPNLSNAIRSAYTMWPYVLFFSGFACALSALRYGR